MNIDAKKIHAHFPEAERFVGFARGRSSPERATANVHLEPEKDLRFDLEPGAKAFGVLDRDRTLAA